MIIFYNKKTGDIFGMFEGRVHDDDTLNKRIIKPNNIPEEDIAKYIVSYKPLTRLEKRMQYKQVVNPDTLEVEQVESGEIEVEVGVGLEMDDKFKEFFSKVESGELSLYRHKFDVNESGEVVGIIEKPVEVIVPATMPRRDQPQPTHDSPDTEGKLVAMQKQIDILTRMVKGDKK